MDSVLMKLGGSTITWVITLYTFDFAIERFSSDLSDL